MEVVNIRKFYLNVKN